jgi:CheY-like chemotaxis protein
MIGEASDGLEAVQKAQELQPDLILLDIGLPSVNGIEAARRIHQVAPGSKILFVSSLALPAQSPTLEFTEPHWPVVLTIVAVFCAAGYATLPRKSIPSVGSLDSNHYPRRADDRPGSNNRQDPLAAY